jgi:hypothetical protein
VDGLAIKSIPKGNRNTSALLPVDYLDRSCLPEIEPPRRVGVRVVAKALFYLCQASLKASDTHSTRSEGHFFPRSFNIRSSSARRASISSASRPFAVWFKTLSAALTFVAGGVLGSSITLPIVVTAAPASWFSERAMRSPKTSGGVV